MNNYHNFKAGRIYNYGEKTYDLGRLAVIYRTAKKICRKCYCRLPLDAKKCRNPKCHNTDLRFKRYESLSQKISNNKKFLYRY